MDNIDKELEDLRSQLTASAQPVKVEEPKPKEEVVVPKEVEAPVTVEKKDELILGKFKSREEADKAHLELEKELTRKSQELAELRKQAETKTAPSVELDSLWKTLFQDDKVEVPVKAEPHATTPNEDQEIPSETQLKLVKLEKKFQDVQKAVAMGLLEQQKTTGKIRAEDKLKNDPILPWTAEVEQEIKDRVFKEFPNLEFQPDGWEKAHKFLRGEKAESIAQVKAEAAVKAALEKQQANKVAVVETPSKAIETPKTIDPSSLDINDLRKYLAERLGVNQYKDGEGIFGLGEGMTFHS